MTVIRGRLPATFARLAAWLTDRRTLVWLVPAALAAVVSFWRITQPALWQDELVTADVSSRSTRQILGLVKHVDAVHAGYYLTMHAWTMIFGNSILALRAPSALAVIFATGCVALTGRRLFSDLTGLVAGIVFAVIPSVSRFAQEARSYGFVLALAALSTLLLLRALDRPTSWRFCGYGLSLAGLIMVNPVASSLVIGHAAAVILSALAGSPQATLAARLHTAGPGLLRFATATVSAAALAAPVLLLGMRQARGQIGWIPHGQLTVVWQQTVASAPVATALLLLTVLAWLGPWRPTATMWAIAATPMLAVYLVSLGKISYFFARQLLFTLPAWAVLAAAGLAALRPRVLVAPALAAIIALATPALVQVRGQLSHGWYSYPAPRHLPTEISIDYPGAAQLISSGYRPGDGIVYARRIWWFALDLGVKAYLPDQLRTQDLFLGRSAAQRRALMPAECAQPAVCLGSPSRIWLVAPTYTVYPLSKLTTKEASAIAARYRVRTLTHLSGVTVALLVPLR